MPSPDPEDIFTGPMSNLTFTESEADSSWMVAKTRLGDKSITVIPLEEEGDLCRLPDTNVMLHKSLAANRKTEFELLRYQVSINRAEIIEWFSKDLEPLPPLFAQSPLLKGIFPLWLVGGKKVLYTDRATFEFSLDKELGLLIRKGGK